MNLPRLRFLLISTVLFIASCSKKTTDTTTVTPPPPPPPPPAVVGENDPVFPGNPTNAVNSTAYPENYLKNSNYYKISYSKSRGIPVWVAWHYQSEDKGSTPRQDNFRPDTDLPTGWYQVQDNSYSGSGFDRGHNCPSGDRTASVAANSSTFLMTNIIPQAPNFNQGPWEGLEDFIRNTLVGTSNEAYEVMGNYGTGGYNSSGIFYGTINGGNVTVPEKVWKVVLVLPKGDNDLTRVSSSTTVLTVIMPNDNRLYSTGGTSAWRNYLKTVDQLEVEANANGVPLNLFQAITDNTIKAALKARLYQ